MKKMMMLMLLVVVMGMGLQSCSKEESTIVTRPDDKVYNTELEVTQQDLISYEAVAGDVGETRYIWLFKNAYKAAQVAHAVNNPNGARYVIFKSWSLSNGKLTFTAEKDGQETSNVYTVKKMYKKLSATEYELQIIVKDGDDTYTFYAAEDGSNHAYAEEWWNLISD